MMPAHRVYVEPFGGGGSVLLRKPRAYAEIYNDLDGEIVNLFRMVRDRGEELLRLIELTPFSREEFELSYEPCDDPLEWARRTMVRCGMGFGSTGLNTDKKTGFRRHLTKGHHHHANDWLRQCSNLPAVTERMSGVMIERMDACELMALHDSADALHYVDPPYLAATRTWRKGHESYRHELTDECHGRLGACLKSLKGKVMVSGYGSDLYDEMFEGWVRVEKVAYADVRAKRTEVVWMNFSPDQGELF
jgi:DNA adenine methylase